MTGCLKVENGVLNLLFRFTLFWRVSLCLFDFDFDFMVVCC